MLEHYNLTALHHTCYQEIKSSTGNFKINLPDMQSVFQKKKYCIGIAGILLEFISCLSGTVTVKVSKLMLPPLGKSGTLFFQL